MQLRPRTDKQGATRFTHTIKATDLGYAPPRRRTP